MVAKRKSPNVSLTRRLFLSRRNQPTSTCTTRPDRNVSQLTLSGKAAAGGASAGGAIHTSSSISLSAPTSSSTNTATGSGGGGGGSSHHHHMHIYTHTASSSSSSSTSSNSNCESMLAVPPISSANSQTPQCQSLMTPSSKSSNGKRFYYHNFYYNNYYNYATAVSASVSTPKKFIVIFMAMLCTVSVLSCWRSNSQLHASQLHSMQSQYNPISSPSSPSTSIGNLFSVRDSMFSHADSSSAASSTGTGADLGTNGNDNSNIGQTVTGSWANCTTDSMKQQQQKQRRLASTKSRSVPVQVPDHKDQLQSTTVSCHDVQYRIHSSSFHGDEEIIIGVLSGAGGSGPSRRMSVRDTWADPNADYTFSDHNFDNRDGKDTDGKERNGQNKIKDGRIKVFFLVAGPWEQIRDEYDKYGDLIWINEEEIYQGEDSVLTYKTQSFIRIVYNVVLELELRQLKYIFKTDDDSYVHVNNLYTELIENENEYSPITLEVKANDADGGSPKEVLQQKKERDFWGWCQLKKFAPKRDASVKWPVSYELYPEPMYPRYCQGAGFALSRRFIECAAGLGSSSSSYSSSSSSSQHHNGRYDNALDGDISPIANLRFMPFEDVSMGMIAERCNVTPIMVERRRWINLYRTQSTEEKNRVKEGLPKIDKSKLTRPVMMNRIVQHRIYDEWDMMEHHKIVVDPARYNKENKVEWYSPRP